MFLVPTAASATISGRVTTVTGNGIRNVIIQLTDAETGEIRSARTSSFGYYRFEDVPVGRTYSLNPAAKRYTFANPSRVINPTGEVTDVDFVSEEQ